jgi:signal transduction histidine kinase
MASPLVEADDLPDGLLVAGADARVELVNAAAERVLGRRAADLLGRDIRTAVPLQDTTGRDWWECTDPWGPGPAIRTGHRERLLIAPPAREVLVAARYVRERRSGPVVRVVVQLHDTEARRRAESDHAGLISTVAHELRSPLTSVKGFTSTLLRRWDRFTDEQKILMLTTVEADADRVTRLISELLDVSRIDAGRLEVRRQPVDVVQAVYAHVDRMVAAGHEPGRFVVLESGPRPEVWADPDRVDQVLGNLVENAVRHGAGTVTVTVRRGDVGRCGP